MKWPQEHADKNKAPLPWAKDFQGQEQEGSGRTSHHVPDICILFIIPFRSFSQKGTQTASQSQNNKNRKNPSWK